MQTSSIWADLLQNVYQVSIAVDYRNTCDP